MKLLIAVTASFGAIAVRAQISDNVVGIPEKHVPGERYQEPFVGPCRGPGGPLDKVNGRSAIEHTQGMCEEACDSLADCAGYSYCDSCNGGECNLHGPGLDGACSDSSATDPAACAALGTCVEDAEKTTASTCGSCSEATAPSEETCGSVGGVWTALTWETAGAVWEDSEDPWTGGSHPSSVIRGTTEEEDSRYLCYDIHPEDHLATCTGSEECEAVFAGMVEADRLAEKCADPCVFVPAPTVPKPKPPHAGDIMLPGWNKAMSGACRGGPDSTDKPNGKYSNTAGADGKLTQEECAAACLDEPECVGYSHATAWCVVYGPGVHNGIGTGEGGAWTTDEHVEAGITGTKPNPSYICVTGPPHPEDSAGFGVHVYAWYIAALAALLF